MVLMFKMAKFDLTKTKAYVILAAFATMLPVVTYFNIPIPKVAWASEVENLKEYQLERFIDIYERELSKKRYENLKLQREQQQILEQEGQIPDSYLKEQEYLESDIRNIEDLIEEAKQKLLKFDS